MFENKTITPQMSDTKPNTIHNNRNPVSATQLTVPLAVVLTAFVGVVAFGMSQWWRAEKAELQVNFSEQLDLVEVNLQKEINEIQSILTDFVSAEAHGRFSNKHYSEFRELYFEKHETWLPTYFEIHNNVKSQEN